MTDTMRKNTHRLQISRNKRKEKEKFSSQTKQYSQVITDYVKKSGSIIRSDENGKWSRHLQINKIFTST
jgi:hypothetical protein